jgi:hypothetical protein
MKGQQKARHPHMDWAREMAFINHFYFYLWYTEWGGAFWKTNAYAPGPIWLWLNGHEWAKRQLERDGIGVYPTLCCYYKPSRIKQFLERNGRYVPRPSPAIPMTSASGAASVRRTLHEAQRAAASERCSTHEQKKAWPFKRRRIPAGAVANLIFAECPFTNLAGC